MRTRNISQPENPIAGAIKTIISSSCYAFVWDVSIDESLTQGAGEKNPPLVKIKKNIN